MRESQKYFLSERKQKVEYNRKKATYTHHVLRREYKAMCTKATLNVFARNETHCVSKGHSECF